MKVLLICPSIRPCVAHLAEYGSLALAPILGECLASHWIEHVAALGAGRVQLIVADEPDRVRETLGEGARWGVQLEVIAVRMEPTPAEAAARFRTGGEPGWLPSPHDIVVMDRMPGCPKLPLFESYASWFAAVLAWAPRALTPARVRVTEIRPGVWVGRRAHVASTAELIAPCWIGDQVFVEPGAIVGPDAILEDRSVVESEARVAQSWVGPDTFVGPMTSVVSSLAWGSRLTDWRSDSSLRVPDPFLLCSLAPRPSGPVMAPPGRAADAQPKADRSALAWIGGWPAQVQRSRDTDGRTGVRNTSL